MFIYVFMIEYAYVSTFFVVIYNNYGLQSSAA